MKLKEWFSNLMVKLGISKAKKKSKVLKELMNEPESFKLEAYIEDEELIIRVRKREIES